MAWQFGLAANAVVTIMYAFIAVLVVRGLRRAHEGWDDNPSGWAIAMIFTTCSLGHGAHMTHLVGLPLLGGELEVIAGRAAYDVHLALVDLTTAVVATLFWSIKVREGDGTKLYDAGSEADDTARRVNDGLVQGLALAAYQLEAGETDSARSTISSTLEEARSLASNGLGSTVGHAEERPATALRRP
jgi:hypothetical protein